MRFTTLADWLAWQETLHPSRIELGLERVRRVWAALRPEADPARLGMPVITVAGTNGKGSTVGCLEACYRAAGYRVCAYTSPHLLRYNERVRIDGHEASDEALCESFARIDAARGDTALTYFEFGTLAAFDLFTRAAPDLVILEVGMGGRLDAVNVIDADLAVITGIARDHTAWLGETLEEIATEKAGICRAGRPAIIGQRDAPPRLRERAEALGAVPCQLGREYDYRLEPGQWTWQGPGGVVRGALPPPALRGRFQYDNAAAALAAIQCLGDRLPLPVAAIRAGLHRVRVPGRCTVFPGRDGQPTWVLDVAHNAQSAAALAGNLAAMSCTGQRHAVLAVLADKEPGAISAALDGLIAHWHLAPSTGDRGLGVADLDAAVAAAARGERHCYQDLTAALDGAAALARPDDCIVVFGSFTTVEAAMRRLMPHRSP